ncbi:protein KASH5 isoform X2 [Hyla sarda]|uniref:protein KASH5 isoform X2 n=1 Tax=Hyla sarda TaxID=327740 RepID=UPI0024C29B25|nr:protein KASH5 isoform X2 [Hyla sarda]
MLDGEARTADERNHHGGSTVSESECWSKVDSSERGLEPTSDDGSSKYFLQTGNLCFEEQILDNVFEVCDTEKRGMVPAFQIIEYLKSVTDPSRDGKRLRCLSHILDPHSQSILVDRMTFHKAMSKWIESCWIERDVSNATEDDITKDYIDIQSMDEYGGYFNRYVGEPTDITIKIAELNSTNKKLSDQKARLQRSLDIAEETNTLLTEEISDLKSKLKNSQQAMQHATSTFNELEDTKILVKNLEDAISVVTAEKKQLEKDELLLSSQRQRLQEENDKLTSEKDKLKEKLDGLRAENSRLLHQLYEYENLLVQKEELLTQKTVQSEELMGLVEEQKTLLLELKNEKNNLQEELLQTHDDRAIHSSHSNTQSLSNEIEEIQESNKNPKVELHDPFCYRSESSDGVEKIEGDIWTGTETESNKNPKIELHDPFYYLSEHSAGMEKIEGDIWTDTETELEEKSIFLLTGLSCLNHLKCAWELYASKLSRGKQINKMSLSQRRRSTEYSLLPVTNQLAVYNRQQQRVQHAISARACMTWLFIEGRCLLAPFLTKLRSFPSTRRLLLLILLYTLGFSMWPGNNILTVVGEILWPHLRLQHLNLPPI